MSGRYPGVQPSRRRAGVLRTCARSWESTAAITTGTARTNPASNDHPTTTTRPTRRWTCQSSGARSSACSRHRRSPLATAWRQLDRAQVFTAVDLRAGYVYELGSRGNQRQKNPLTAPGPSRSHSRCSSAGLSQERNPLSSAAYPILALSSCRLAHS